MNRQEVIALLEELGLVKAQTNDIVLDNTLSSLVGEDVIESHLETRISNTLKRLGMSCNLLGYKYLRTAIKDVYEDYTLMQGVTKVLYPNIAKMYGTTSSRVERAIRHAIETAWLKGDAVFINRLFKYTVSYSKSKPTNSEFIAMLADELKLKNI